MNETITYFEKEGKENTAELIRLVKQKVEKTGIKYIAIASVSGETAMKLADEINDIEIINVTHNSGFKEPNNSEISDEMIEKLKIRGIKTFRGSHAFSGACRGVTNKFDGVSPLDVVAQTLRMFSHGVKVSCEISLMLTDAGMIPVGEEIIAIGGRAHGVDSAIILTPVNTANLFDLKIHEIIAMPRP
ncbi:pyruvate kinase alpha/beta domain-containing protein [Methanobrevibacter sp. DSM 116169]|uniref:pyruvate kinase alpha/beta domain-containing protein n=1 Tax=Methanobrevibacter sp. DSM 116169 TaxID=3242727 RepID=UPI0038FC12F2